MQNRNYFLGEDDFRDKMENIVVPFLNNIKVSGYFESFDKSKIAYSYYIHPREKASIVISHGFCEFEGKYKELIYYFYQEGYSVFFINHRGHGYSQRAVKDWDKVHVNSYNEYTADLLLFMKKIVRVKSLTHKYFLFAHSMGGAIGALFLEQYPGYFKAAVLSSPLMEMNSKKVPACLVGPVLFVGKIMKRNTKYIPGQREFHNVSKYWRSGTLSRARYEYTLSMKHNRKEYRTHGGTYGWTIASYKATRRLRRNAGKVQIPVLLCQAGRDTLVKPRGQRYFAVNSGNTKLVRFPLAKHEIFNGDERIRKEYFRLVFHFLSNV